MFLIYSLSLSGVSLIHLLLTCAIIGQTFSTSATKGSILLKSCRGNVFAFYVLLDHACLDSVKFITCLLLTGQLLLAKGEVDQAFNAFKIVLDGDRDHVPSLLGQVCT